MSIEKHITTYLIVNWKTGDVRILKRVPKQLKMAGADIPLTLDLTLKIPEPQELKLKAEVTLGEAEVSGIAMEAFDESTRQ
jgi:hypothetical protein